MATFRHTFLRNTCCAFADSAGLEQALLAHDTETSVLERQEEEFISILDGLGSGPSPAQLVVSADGAQETPPLSYFVGLPQDQALTIATAVQDLFERDFRPDLRRAALEPLGTALFARLDAFLADTNLQRMNEVQDAARALYAEMRTLPRGIWFWDDEHTRNT